MYVHTIHTYNRRSMPSFTNDVIRSFDILLHLIKPKRIQHRHFDKSYELVYGIWYMYLYTDNMRQN